MPVLFSLGQVVLSSGQESDWKIDCDALTDADWVCLAAQLARRLPPFGPVEAVPTGGCKLAREMQVHATSGQLLICDDVCTTGGSLARHRAGREAIGAVVFARGALPPWVTALFTLTSYALDKSIAELTPSVRVRRCAQKLGIETVGELLQYSGEELLEVKNFGQVALQEVRTKLAVLGLGLRGE